MSAASGELASDPVALNNDVLQSLHAHAAAEAARAMGLSPSAALALNPLLQNPSPTAGLLNESSLLGGEALPSCSTSLAPLDSTGQPEQLFTCTVCRKVFKREMNLIFHMTTHRPRQPELEPADSMSTQPVKCQDCGKEFATKYQAKKHFLRRHFQGEKPFACTKCNKKRFVVKEDLTMHMKSCGNVYVCNCGIRLCSLGALKRHCKYFSHEPESLEPQPDPVTATRQHTLGWNGLDSSVATDASLADANPMIQGLQGMQGVQGVQGVQGMHGEMPATSAGLAGPGLAQSLAARYTAGLLQGGLGQGGMGNRTGVGALGALTGGLSGLGALKADHTLSAALNSYQQLVPGAAAGSTSGNDGSAIPQGLLPLGSNRPTSGVPVSAPYPISSAAEDAMGTNWASHPALSGMMPSLAQALRRGTLGTGVGALGGLPPSSDASVAQHNVGNIGQGISPRLDPHLGGIGGGVAAAALSAAVSAAFNGQQRVAQPRLDAEAHAVAVTAENNSMGPRLA